VPARGFKRPSRDGSLKILYEKLDMLTGAQKKRLLETARGSMAEYLNTGNLLSVKEADPILNEKRGAFVTLKKNGDLRGCIGHIICDMPLYKTVNQMAVESATGDPRFSPLEIRELEDIIIEISVMTPLELIDDITKIEPGRHGLLIRKGFHSGLLLPQVAGEYGWTREEFLENTCYKAGLAKGDWKRDAQIYTFEAEVFSEKEG